MSGPALVRLCEAAGLEVSHETVTDSRDAIRTALTRLADAEGVRFVLPPAGPALRPTT